MRRSAVIPGLLGAALLVGPVQGGATATFFQAKVHFEEGRPRRAGALFGQAGREGYDPREVHLWMGRCYFQTKSPRRALQHFRKARQLGADGLVLWRGIGWAAHATADHDALDEAIAEILRREPEDPTALLWRGERALDEVRFQAAFQDLKRAVVGHPDEVKSMAGKLPMSYSRPLVEAAEIRLGELAEEAARPPQPEDAAPAEPEGPKSVPYQGTRFDHLAAGKVKRSAPTRRTSGSSPPARSGGPMILKRRRSAPTVASSNRGK